MPHTVVEFSPSATTEVQAAFQWYEDRSPVAAKAFAEEIDRAVTQIAEQPERWTPHTQGTRRFLLRRFPFSLIYRLHGSTVTVIAVAHARRRPQYWAEGERP